MCAVCTSHCTTARCNVDKHSVRLHGSKVARRALVIRLPAVRRMVISAAAGPADCHGPCTNTIIIGGGRVGRALGRMLAGKPHQTLRRNDAYDEFIPADGTGPLYVATTNDALADVVARVPAARRSDLVLLQNGWLLPWLEANKLSGRVTQVALYMAANDDGSVKDGLRTAAAGRWATHVATTLGTGGVLCAVLDEAQLQVALVEKMLWASIFWMLSAALGGKQVGDIAREDAAAVAQLVDELLPLLQQDLAVNSSPPAQQASRQLHRADVLSGLTSYSISIATAVPSRSMALAEFAWRNGALLRLGRTPQHLAWLQRAGVSPELLLQ